MHFVTSGVGIGSIAVDDPDVSSFGVGTGFAGGDF